MLRLFISRKVFFYLAFLTLVCSSCVEMTNGYSKVAPGIWRATLDLDVDKKPINNAVESEEETTRETEFEGELPFLFEVVYNEDSTFFINIINGTEKIKVDDISYGIDKATAKDTLIINFPVYDSYIRAIVEGGIMEGHWFVNNRENYSIPFMAKYGKNHRFSLLNKTPAIDMAGRWKTKFDIDTEGEYPGIGEFTQDGNIVRGTFRTETGDYRYLDGEIQDNKLYLSCFDGAHAFLFEAKVQADKSLVGTFRSGKHYQNIWSAKKDESFKLKDPNDLTYLVNEKEKFDFQFENSSGKMVGLNDESYKGKPRIVQIFGTWCPNCRDEANFLLDYLKKNPKLDLEIIALAFEKRSKKEEAWNKINTYKSKMDIPWEILYAGPSSKSDALKSLPMLNKIISYPTMIFVDRDGAVRKIHTGFNGPATSLFEEFKQEFEENIKLISE